MTDRVLNLRRAAKLLGLRATHLRDLAERGEVPGVKLDGGWLFTESALANWVNQLLREKGSGSRTEAGGKVEAASGGGGSMEVQGGAKSTGAAGGGAGGKESMGTEKIGYEDYFEYTAKERDFDPYAFGDWQLQYAEMMDAAFDLRDKRLLDVGCAGGAVLLGLYRRGADAYGCDINRAVIEGSPFEELAGRLRVVETDRLTEYYPEDSWDIIHSAQVFEHFPGKEYSERVVACIAHLLRSGGVFYCSLDVGEHMTQEDLLAIRARGEPIDVTHINIWPISYWREILSAQGLVDLTSLFVPITDCYQAEGGWSFFSEYAWNVLVYGKDPGAEVVGLCERRLSELLERQKDWADTSIYSRVLETREVSPSLRKIIERYI